MGSGNKLQRQKEGALALRRKEGKDNVSGGRRKGRKGGERLECVPERESMLGPLS